MNKLNLEAVGTAAVSRLREVLSMWEIDVEGRDDPKNRRYSIYLSMDVKRGDLRGQRFAQEFGLDPLTLVYMDEPERWVIERLLDVARNFVCSLIDRTAKAYAKLNGAAEAIDWRPAEAIPEDFYAA